MQKSIQSQNLSALSLVSSTSLLSPPPCCLSWLFMSSSSSLPMSVVIARASSKIDKSRSRCACPPRLDILKPPLLYLERLGWFVSAGVSAGRFVCRSYDDDCIINSKMVGCVAEPAVCRWEISWLVWPASTRNRVRYFIVIFWCLGHSCILILKNVIFAMKKWCMVAKWLINYLFVVRPEEHNCLVDEKSGEGGKRMFCASAGNYRGGKISCWFCLSQ